MNLDIEFPNLPCFLIEIFMRTSVNQIDEEILASELSWHHVGQDDQIVYDFSGLKPFKDIDLNNEVETTDLIKNFYDKNLKCRVRGSIDFIKVTGQLIFKKKGHSKALHKFKKNTE
jgi:hypothetical protein